MINQSIDEYINQMINNVSLSLGEQQPQVIDIVLDGGLFNGSYQIGALYFIKKLEERKHVKVDRLSGCSIGAIVAFLFLIDRLDYIYEFYEICKTHFQTHYNFDFMLNLKAILSKCIPKDVCKRVNNRLYISYNNAKTGEKRVKMKYRDVDEVIDTLIESCYLPYFIDGNIAYKNRYVDGITPYIFKERVDRRTLYLDLFGFDKITHFYSIQNESTNHHRVLSGMLDAHWFFTKGQNTQMCSYVNEWGYTNYGWYYLKRIAEKMISWMVYLLLICKKYMGKSNFYKLVSEILHQILLTIIKKCML